MRAFKEERETLRNVQRLSASKKSGKRV